MQFWDCSRPQAGFDLCHFNLHKTFSAPHGGSAWMWCSGSERLFGSFLPVPTVEFDSSKYFFNYDHPQSIGKVRSFYGNFGAVLRTYM